MLAKAITKTAEREARKFGVAIDTADTVPIPGSEVRGRINSFPNSRKRPLGISLRNN